MFIYFINLNKINVFLDNNTIICLTDQFLEQALASEREALHFLEKKMPTEDLLDDARYIRCKIDELYMCALSCFSAVGWDLRLLINKLK